ncbi:MAG: hypothetical protein RIM23_29585 [Coleofasciculus sp. G3-WIS-01]|uniref:hypothetical protein n=1 Tax=Coleofasciculus sp. G3-WIS-01 TaxID=3069528 RepID=UPI0032F1B4B4
MSVYENSIISFIKVIETNANLLTPPDWENLNQLSNQLPNDDIENISDQLENWLKASASRQEFFQRYEEQREAVTDAEVRDFQVIIGVGGSKSPTPANQPSPAAKDMIINSIIRNSPPSTPQTNPPKNK